MTPETRRDQIIRIFDQLRNDLLVRLEQPGQNNSNYYTQLLRFESQEDFEEFAHAMAMALKAFLALTGPRGVIDIFFMSLVVGYRVGLEDALPA